MKKENKLLLLIFILSFLLPTVTFQDSSDMVPVWLLAIVIVGAVAGNVFLWIKKRKRQAFVLWNVISGGTLLTLLGIRFVCFSRQKWGMNPNAVAVFGIAVGALVLMCMLWIMLKEKEENAIVYIILGSFFLRAFYVIMTQAHYFQNDVGSLGEGNYGHLGYVYYLFQNASLPKESYNQFYHPPLHHAIMAIAMKIYTLLGIKTAGMEELLQCLPLFYTSATIVYLNKIGIKLGLSEKGRMLGVGFAAFLPYSIMQAAALNNDALMILLDVMFVYYLICWYQESTWSGIILMAVTIGGAMMTKFSGVLLAPAAAVIMLAKVWKERKELSLYIKQLLLFVLISFPLGLWHPLYNYLKFELPLGYVPQLSDTMDQYIGYFSGEQRLFGLSEQFEVICLQWSRYEPGVSYNIPVSMIKFAVFGEGTWLYNGPTMQFIGTAMFWLVFVLFAVMFAGCILWLLKKDGKGIYKLFFGLSIFTVFSFYVKFCLDYPHICTMNVRYVLVGIYMAFLAMAAGLTAQNEKKTKSLKCITKVAEPMWKVMLGAYILCCSLMVFHLELILV